MKVLTLHQPWASLLALGVKTIETRSWSTQYRGPLAIHAGIRRLTGEVVGEYKTFWDRIDAEFIMEHYGTAASYLLHLGAIVATCTLVDVAPIGGPTSFRTGTFDGDEGDMPGRPVVVHHPQLADWLSESLMLDHGTVTNITDQLPYGDFTPGRFAWLLADIVPVDPPVPFKCGQGLTKTWTP